MVIGLGPLREDHTEAEYKEQEKAIFFRIVSQFREDLRAGKPFDLLDDIERYWRCTKQPALRKRAEEFLRIYAPERLVPVEIEDDEVVDEMLAEMHPRLAAVAGDRGAWCSGQNCYDQPAFIAVGRKVAMQLFEKIVESERRPRRAMLTLPSATGPLFDTLYVTGDESLILEAVKLAEGLGLVELGVRPLAAVYDLPTIRSQPGHSFDNSSPPREWRP